VTVQSVLSSVITIGIDPTIEIGPITIAWHALMIAIGIVAAWRSRTTPAGAASSPSASPRSG